MKKMIVSLTLLFSACCVPGTPPKPSSGQQGRASENSQKPSVQGSSFTFREVEPIIRLESRVPPMLPGFLPYADEKHPIYAIAESIDTTSYRIMLAFVVPCAGGHNCLYGSVRGSVTPFIAGEGKSVPIMLQGGIKGRFIKSVCDINCTQAHVEWSENSYYYSVGIKAEDMKTMIKVANSAIAAGHMARH